MILLRAIRAVWRRIKWLLAGIFEPPLAAIARIIRRWRDAVVTALETLLQWWERIWQPNSIDPKRRIEHPSAAAPLVAAGILAITVYLWPAWRYIHGAWYYLIAVAVWLVAFVWARRSSTVDSLSRWRPALREAQQRAGLIWCERLGGVAGFACLILAVRFDKRAIVLALAALYAFLRILVLEYSLRELQMIRQAPLPDVDEPSATEGFVERSYTWALPLPNGEMQDQDLTLLIDEASYSRMKSENTGRAVDSDGMPLLVRWVTSGTTAEVDRAARRLAEQARDRVFSSYREIANVLAMVQSIPYVLDIDSTGQEDYWRYPIETLYDDCGDCEDTTILAAAILRRMGHRVALLLLPEHAALGVEAPPGTDGRYVTVDGRRMYYCETTDSGWRVGEIPPDMEGKDIQPIAVPS